MLQSVMRRLGGGAIPGVAALVAVLVGAPGMVPPLAAQAPAVDSTTFPATPLVAMGMRVDPRIAAALRDISSANIRHTDSMLVSFGTRHTMSDTMSATRGIGAARHFVYATLAKYSKACGGCLRVEYDPAMMVVNRAPSKPTVNVVNVLAWLPGRDTTRVVVLGGHYDSCICSINPFDSVSNAPGADDDASGSAAVMELARVFSQRFPKGFDATVVFALYAGEEQGLLGSTHLAQRLHDAGYHVAAGMADDMDGNVSADDGRIDSTTVRLYGGDPDNGPARELMRYAWALDTLYTPALRVLPVERLDRIFRGTDDIPFVLKGDAGIRFTERLENYKRQHRPDDVMAFVNFGYTANIARLNGATIAALASAPPPPDSARAARETKVSGGQRWTMTWKPSPGATKYEVLVRRTTSPVWEKVYDVGNVTEFLLPDQLDDDWAAVRAVGANGSRSLAVSVPAPRAVTH